MATPLYLLSGPTAAGKTGLAHTLAERHGLRLLSVDSMMVYRGMDIGTAKPTPGEIEAHDYAGLNLADPGEAFSAGAWLRAVARQLDARPTLAVGGTGLYFRALMFGLDEGPRGGAGGELSVDALRAAVREQDPGALDRLADPWNPRRLERALKWLEAGRGLPDGWEGREEFPLPVLRWSTEELNRRIEVRVREMFHCGLLEECRRLREAGALTGTAAQAIGYREAMAVLAGEMDEETAAAGIATRTRRYAKRQRTWFRNQMDARWVEMTAEAGEEALLARIESVWNATGPLWFTGEAG